MKPVIAVLAHKNFERLAQVVRYLSNAGLQVCIHIDNSADDDEFHEFKTSLSDCPEILWAKRISCEWGRFSLVEATLEMSSEILERWPDCGHVVLLSGDSLPTRPPSELVSFLDENLDVDFIESVSAGNDNWVTGGLGTERFTLTFPFSWKKQRWLFDKWVDIQRKLRVKRRIPSDIQPHIGSQWWCLTRRTLQAILNDPSRPEHDAYFRKCWIPDESYFQTLARKHARKLESRALVFARFDHQGKPTPFYDDHADVIGSFEAFFVRKIWPGASKLYQQYLDPKTVGYIESGTGEQGFTQYKIANERRKVGRSGLYMHGRAPCQWHQEYSPTATSYDVFSNVKAVFPNIDDWLELHANSKPHGRVFSPEKVHFKCKSSVGPGGMSSNTKIRDLAPENFLCNLVWNTRTDGLKFHFEGNDTDKIEEFLASDPHANIFYIRHGWILDLLTSGIENPYFLRDKSIGLINREATFLSKLKASEARCQLNVWTVGEAITKPNEILGKILDQEDAARNAAPMILPEMADACNLPEFARKLRNIGVDVDFALIESPTTKLRAASHMRASI